MPVCGIYSTGSGKGLVSSIFVPELLWLLLPLLAHPHYGEMVGSGGGRRQPGGPAVRVGCRRRGPIRPRLLLARFPDFSRAKHVVVPTAHHEDAAVSEERGGVLPTWPCERADRGEGSSSPGPTSPLRRGHHCLRRTSRRRQGPVHLAAAWRCASRASRPASPPGRRFPLLRSHSSAGTGLSVLPTMRIRPPGSDVAVWWARASVRGPAGLISLVSG